MLNLLIVAGLVVSSLVSPGVAQAASTPPTDKITIDVQTINGSGCPVGTPGAGVRVADDNTSFFVTYSNFTAEAGYGTTAVDGRKNCQINILVHVPQGFTYAIAEADYQGFASLAGGANALEQANYYFSGTAPTARVRHTLNGPFGDDWNFVDVTDSASLVYAPCGVDRNLNINTELRVSAGSSDPRSTSFIEMDTTHASVFTLYHFAWKRC